ncbi:zinc finger, CCHC-type containing protein [Tanacetum coccineum]
MGDENPIRALGDYSKPSHEGYRNTIELLDRNNVVPLRSDTIWLVQNGCSFHGLWSEDPNQHLKDFLKLGSISTWEDLTTHFLAQFFPSGRTVKLQNDILMLQQYQGKLKEEIMMEENKVKKIEKITRYPDTEDLEPLNDYKFLETLMKKESFHTPKSAPASSLYTMSKRARNTRGQSSSSHEISLEERIRGFGIFDRGVHQMHHDTLATRLIHSGNVNLFQINERVYRELVHDFLASIEFESTACRIGLYFEDQSREDSTLRNTSVNKVRDPRIKLTHCCIPTTISSRRDSTQRITKIDLFYLYYIYTKGVVCNISYWLTKYLKGVRERNLICGGMFVTKIARSFGLLTREMVDGLNVEPSSCVFNKKSLITMGVIMELHEGECYWPATRKAGEDDEAEKAAKEEAGGLHVHTGM